MADNKRPLLSIIVPVYNTGAYIRECVDSVLCQEISDWELLLIDDGSKEECALLCDEIAGSDERISAFHKENEGQLRTRLYGIERARGEYVTGLDSDDIYSKDMLKVVFDAILGAEKKPDIVSFNLAFFEHGDDPYTAHTDIIQNTVNEELKGTEFLKKILINTDNSFCDKVIKKALFDAMDFSDAPSSIRVSEDYLMIMPIVNGADNVSLLTDVLYYYRQHSDSANHMSNGQRVVDELKAGSYVYNYLSKQNALTKELEAILLDSTMGQFAHRLKASVKTRELSKDVCERIYAEPIYDRLRNFESTKFVTKDKIIILKLLRLRMSWLINLLYSFRR